MPEPFVFSFRAGEGAQPEQMYLADIRAECELCGHEQIQRYYHATPLHPVTVATLERLARSVASKTDYDCPNCGTHVAVSGARSTALTWAFADDSGLIRGYVSDTTAPDSLCWQLVRDRRLDPQELPGWAPDPAEPALGELDEDAIEGALGRVLSVKAAIRDVLEDWMREPQGGAIAALGRGMTLVAAGPDVGFEELAAEVDPDHVVISLDEAVPVELPTHRDPTGIGGALDGWLPGGVDRSQVQLLVRPTDAFAVIERAFDVANLERARDELGFRNITTPRDVAYPRSLPILAVLRRAVYTGLTPGDAARLTAEEIVGTLLRVW